MGSTIVLETKISLFLSFFLEWLDKIKEQKRLPASCIFFSLFNRTVNGIFIQLILVNNFAGQKVSATTEKVEFKCPSGYGNGNFADPSTCRRFYQVSFLFYIIKFMIRLFFFFISWLAKEFEKATEQSRKQTQSTSRHKTYLPFIPVAFYLSSFLLSSLKMFVIFFWCFRNIFLSIKMEIIENESPTATITTECITFNVFPFIVSSICVINTQSCDFVRTKLKVCMHYSSKIKISILKIFKCFVYHVEVIEKWAKFLCYSIWKVMNGTEWNGIHFKIYSVISHFDEMAEFHLLWQYWLAGILSLRLTLNSFPYYKDHSIHTCVP